MDAGALRASRILIVDDQKPNVVLLEDVLRQAGYTNIKSTMDPRQVVKLHTEFQPDLILLDLMMPHLDGFEVMDLLRPLVPADTYMPILVLTADMTLPTRQRALASGAKDFLVKPSDQTEILLRIKNLLETRHLHLELQGQNQMLEEKVHERTRELEESHVEMLARLAVAAEYRDDDTGRHTQRVGEAATQAAKALGLSDSQVELIRRAAPLHDVGKIGIPDSILLKPGRLTPQEFEVIKTHTTIGAKILSGGRYPLLQLAEVIALNHHERWDGQGYPRGLKGGEVPLEARIVAVADAFDAMTNDRPYRHAYSPEDAWEILLYGAGEQWDEHVVEAFASVKHRPRGREDHERNTVDAVHRRQEALHSGR